MEEAGVLGSHCLPFSLKYHSMHRLCLKAVEVRCQARGKTPQYLVMRASWSWALPDSNTYSCLIGLFDPRIPNCKKNPDLLTLLKVSMLMCL